MSTLAIKFDDHAVDVSFTKTSLHFGRSDSPITNLGNSNFSKIVTLNPAFKSLQAAIEPLGPPPIISTSQFSSMTTSYFKFSFI